MCNIITTLFINIFYNKHYVIIFALFGIYAKKTPLKGVSCVLPGTRTLDPLIKSQLLYQLS